MEDIKNLNPMNVFGQFSESYEDAVKKQAEETQSFTKTKYFRIDSAGQYPVRILPIAPTQDQVTGEWTLDRKGYEYPIKTNILCLENPAPKSKKDKKIYVPIVQSTYSGISVDLIDTYINLAEDKFGDDEKLIEKIKSSSFNGGLKWNSQRAMYIYDLNKRGDGLQVLMLSYSQYKDLEERKLDVWKKLLGRDPKAACPISSPMGAFPVEITRKEEGGQTKYTFNVDTLSGVDQLSEEEMQALLDAPRLPEALYRYSRYHLEATIEFLKQYDDKMDLDIMKSKEIADTIEKIKLELPADDKSHFSFSKDNKDGESEAKGNDIDSLWDRWEKLQDDGVGEKDEESMNLRDDIKAFIDENELEVRVTRTKTNKQLLEAIEDAMENAKEEAPAEEPEKTETASEEEESEEADDASHEKEDKDSAEEPVAEDNEEEEEETPRRSHRGEHNDDTNEPAVGSERRRSRPARRTR